MGGKRKKALPQRADESKRQLMTWNMSDLTPNEMHIIPDNDPTLAEEQKNTESASSNESITTDLCNLETGEALNSLIENSEFYLTILREIKLTRRQQCFYLGNIFLFLSGGQGIPLRENPPQCDECYLYINPVSSRHMLYYEFFENDENQASSSQNKQSPTKKTVIYYLAQTDFPNSCFESLQAKCFMLQYGSFDKESGVLLLKVFVTDQGLTKLSFASEGKKMKKLNSAIQTLIAHFYESSIRDVPCNKPLSKKLDMDEVFSAVKEYHRLNDPASPHVNVQHVNLKPYLRSYQKRAILWMLARENYGDQNTEELTDENIHPLYEEITILDGKKLYFNKYSGYLTLERPVKIRSPPGGILADEMGLGKTVEVLACIMTHRRQDLIRVEPRPVITTPAIDQKEPCEKTVSSEANSVETSSFNLESDDLANSKETNSKAIESSRRLDKSITGDSLTNTDSNKFSDTSGAFDSVETSVNSLEEESPNESNESSSNKKSAGTYWRVDGPSESFECLCGTKDEMIGDDKKLNNPLIVQCEHCKLWQHAKCVNYDLTDPNRGRFLCPHCHVSATPVSSGATLIITPNAISHQWVDEIFKHVRQETLSVFVYTGVHKQGFVQPQTLANQDIVITTYETLRKEIDYVDLPHSNSEGGRKLRQPKRYMATPSPITTVEWWRICLDEAQMVECTTTKTANMALRLSAVNRWCVTGTPIQKSLEDVYGLLLFLGQDPYWVHMWWKMLLFDPFSYGNKEPLLNVLGRVLWRTCKADVIEEICLPMQSDTVHWLSFSPVEDHFYKRQYQACSREALQKLRKLPDSSVRLSDLDRQTLHKLLYPLTRLRQACCHPQAVKGAFLPIHKSMMTMEELLTQLTKKAKQESEEAHRQYVAAGNGLAALCIVREEYSEAVDLYRDILRSVEEHKDMLRTDELQQLHAMHNLHELLQLKPQGIGPTLRDGQLEDQCRDIRTRYMQKAENFVQQGHQSWIQAKQSLNELQGELRTGINWWADTIHHYIGVGYGDNLVLKVKEDLSDSATGGVESIIRKFRDARGLLFLLSVQLDELQVSHNKLVTALNSLDGAPTNQEIINKTVECCLRPSGVKLADCMFCKADELFDDYEGKLYCFVDKGVESNITEETGVEGHIVHTKRQGTWADSETEKALKAVLSFAKSWHAERSAIDYGTTHIKMFEALKKEFKAMRTVWIETKANVATVDELDMATTRIRVRLHGEPVSDPPQPNIIEQGEVEQTSLKFKSDRIIGSNELRKKLGQLLYLKNLSNTQGSIVSGKNPEPCPICQQELGSKWSVLHCGHCFCMECIRLMMDRYSFGGTNGSMKCPVCRQKTRHAEIAYVSTKKSTEESSGVKIKGDHSTKVEGILHCLLQIHQKDPEAKCLVFSTWNDILWVLAKALDDNDVSYKLLSSYKFQNNLASFKHDKDLQVLLLPIHSGANGLNLIEATHVLLVEPILNPAQELQAIGRVHRIGQTKATFVHRFIVKGTIEQKMHSLLQSSTGDTENTIINSHNAEQTTFTVGDLKALFEDTDYLDDESSDDEENRGDQVVEEENPDMIDNQPRNQEASPTSTPQTEPDERQMEEQPSAGEPFETDGLASATQSELDKNQQLQTSSVVDMSENIGLLEVDEIQQVQVSSKVDLREATGVVSSATNSNSGQDQTEDIATDLNSRPDQMQQVATDSNAGPVPMPEVVTYSNSGPERMQEVATDSNSGPDQIQEVKVGSDSKPVHLQDVPTDLNSEMQEIEESPAVEHHHPCTVPSSVSGSVLQQNNTTIKSSEGEPCSFDGCPSIIPNPEQPTTGSSLFGKGPEPTEPMVGDVRECFSSK